MKTPLKSVDLFATNHHQDELTALLETAGLVPAWFRMHPDGNIREMYGMWRLACDLREEANLARVAAMAVSFHGPQTDRWKDADANAGRAEVALFVALKRWVEHG